MVIHLYIDINFFNWTVSFQNLYFGQLLKDNHNFHCLTIYECSVLCLLKVGTESSQVLDLQYSNNITTFQIIRETITWIHDQFLFFIQKKKKKYDYFLFNVFTIIRKDSSHFFNIYIILGLLFLSLLIL